MTKATFRYDPIVKQALASDKVRRFVFSPTRHKDSESATFRDGDRTVVVTTSPPDIKKSEERD